MWSLRSTLQTLAKGGHLPAGFQPSRGLRLLFPLEQSADLSLSVLQKYLYSQTGRVVLEAIATSFCVAADGAGNWLLQGSMTAGTEPGGEECKWGAGFVFRFSRDATGHGFVATGDFNPNTGGKPAQMNFVTQGRDPWISANWPDAFAKGNFFYLSDAIGFEGLPDTGNAAKNHGFAALTPLEAASSLLTTYVQVGTAPSFPSGPGGVDWDIPPTGDGTDPGG
jgi:hypothetical protein